MSSVTLITGAATGIGNLTARSLAAAGHLVYASMQDPTGRNAARAQELTDFARRGGFDLRIVELDVQEQQSADNAVALILKERGRLDTVVHNAGHLYIGFVEAFTAEDVARLFDINAIGIQRVNRAALPQMRKQRRGTLIYVGSTTSVVVPPFLGPYVASKSAADALAQVTAYEVGQFGIETTIVMPGPFLTGTEHYPNASRASDARVTAAYSEIGPLVSRNEEATAGLFRPDVEAHPVAVADEITRILSLPAGTRPARTVVDFTDAGVDEVNRVMRTAQENFLTRMGYADLLRVQR